MQRKPFPVYDLVLIILCIVIGCLIRLDFLIPTGFVVDSDEAIVGLMAKHIVEGKGIPTFYYGQHYMGSLEPIVAAVVFALFGISEVALKCVPLFFALLLIPLVYLLAREVGGVVAGRVAALLMTFPPSPMIIWSGKARGGFVELICIGALALLLAFRWQRGRKSDFWLPAIIWCLLGVGWWVNNQIIYFIIPIGILFCSRAGEVSRGGTPAVLKTVGVCFLAFLCGSAPFWIYNVERGFPSFGMFHFATGTALVDHVQGLFAVALPILFGGKRDWSVNDYFPTSTLMAYVLYGGVLLTALSLRRAELTRILFFRWGRVHPIDALIVFVIGAWIIFAVSSFGFLYQAPRYLLPTYVGLFPIVGYVVARLWNDYHRATLWLLCCFFLVHGASAYHAGRAIPGEPFVYNGERVSRDHSALIRWLNENRIEWVKTNYWIGYRLAFETQERVRFMVYKEPLQRRIRSYEDEGRLISPSRVPYILVPSQATIVRAALTRLGYSWGEAFLSGYVILYDVTPPPVSVRPVPANHLSATSTPNSTVAGRAIDGDLNSRWGSAHPQAPGMEFVVSLDKPRIIGGIDYRLGEWIQDSPRGLVVQVETPSGERLTVSTGEEGRAIEYFREEEEDIVIYISPVLASKVILSLSGSHPIFDWSIAELTILEHSDGRASPTVHPKR